MEKRTRRESSAGEKREGTPHNVAARYAANGSTMGDIISAAA